jgi:hypothetical protein
LFLFIEGLFRPASPIIVTLLIAVGFWLYQAPGHGTSIEHSPASDK